MSEKKVVRRSVAIALGIACVILIAGLGGVMAYYSTVVNDKNTIYGSYASSHSHTDSDYNSLQSAYDNYVWSHGPPASQFVANELMIKFRQGMVPTEPNAAVGGYVQTGLSSIDALNAKYCIDSIEPLMRDPDEHEIKYGFDRVYLFKSTRDFDVQEAVEEYSTDPNVEYAEPNYIVTIR
ncbi:hypothetical protein MUO56_06015 [Candidatus Bathyarchaeota archaeon]|nr:hypothetical protein [Candidatus Bathyarchaeota archaeon]